MILKRNNDVPEYVEKIIDDPSDPNLIYYTDDSGELVCVCDTFLRERQYQIISRFGKSAWTDKKPEWLKLTIF